MFGRLTDVMFCTLKQHVFMFFLFFGGAVHYTVELEELKEMKSLTMYPIFHASH